MAETTYSIENNKVVKQTTYTKVEKESYSEQEIDLQLSKWNALKQVFIDSREQQ